MGKRTSRTLKFSNLPALGTVFCFLWGSLSFPRDTPGSPTPWSGLVQTSGTSRSCRLSCPKPHLPCRLHQLLFERLLLSRNEVQTQPAVLLTYLGTCILELSPGLKLRREKVLGIRLVTPRADKALSSQISQIWVDTQVQARVPPTDTHLGVGGICGCPRGEPTLSRTEMPFTRRHGLRLGLKLLSLSSKGTQP